MPSKGCGHYWLRNVGRESGDGSGGGWLLNVGEVECWGRDHGSWWNGGMEGFVVDVMEYFYWTGVVFVRPE